MADPLSFSMTLKKKKKKKLKRDSGPTSFTSLGLFILKEVLTDSGSDIYLIAE